MGIATGIDELLDLVQERKKISIREAAKKLKVEEDKVETWSRVLSDEDMLELVYPTNPLEPPFLQVVGYTEKKKRKKKKKKEVYKEKKKKKPKEKRKLPKGAFLNRFRSSRRKEFKTYKQKVQESKEKRKSPKRNQLILLILVIIVVIILLIYFEGSKWFPDMF